MAITIHRTAVAAAITAMFARAGVFIVRCTDTLFAWIDAALDAFRPASPFAYAGDTDTLELRAHGKSIDSATLNSLRHEAGQSRRASGRNS